MEHLKKILREALPAKFGVKGPLTDDTKLFSSGLIDSLSVLELVSLVESETGCQIPPAQITLETFDTIERIARLAQSLAPAAGRPK